MRKISLVAKRIAGLDPGRLPDTHMAQSGQSGQNWRVGGWQRVDVCLFGAIGTKPGCLGFAPAAGGWCAPPPRMTLNLARTNGDPGPKYKYFDPYTRLNVRQRTAPLGAQAKPGRSQFDRPATAAPPKEDKRNESAPGSERLALSASVNCRGECQKNRPTLPECVLSNLCAAGFCCSATGCGAAGGAGGAAGTGWRWLDC